MLGELVYCGKILSGTDVGRTGLFWGKRGGGEADIESEYDLLLMSLN